MRRKRDYKTVQLGFRTQKEYEKFHQNAEKFFGDGRSADCAYLRECIQQNIKRRNKSMREKAKALVESTQRLNDLRMATADPYIQDEISEILAGQVKIWEF